MIEDVGRWYLIVSPRPNSETLEKRSRSVAALVAHLSKKGNQDTIPDAIEGIAWRFARDDRIPATVAESIRVEDLAYTGTANRLELRLLAGLAIGEIMERPSSDPHLATVCSTLTLSALGIRRLETSRARKLAEFMKALRQSAWKLLEAQAAVARRVAAPPARLEAKARFDEMQKAVEAVPPQGAKEVWEAVSPHLKLLIESNQSRMSAIEHLARIQREELEVLWWTYSGRSSTTGQSFSRMKPGMAAFCCGRELGDLVLLPPPSNAKALLKDALALGARGGSDTSPVTLAAVVDDWELEPLKQSGCSVEGAQVNYPGVFPLSWIAHRLTESELTADWRRELEVRVGVSPDHAMPLSGWAEQAMWERAAQRILEK